MSYDEWIDAINVLKERNDENIKNKIVSESLNLNLQEMLEPKLIELIKFKLNISINKIKNLLDDMFNDKYILDLYLNNFKRDLYFIVDLLNVKQLTNEKKESMKKKIIESTNETYDILIKEAQNIDPIGILEQVIKNNRIKWS